MSGLHTTPSPVLRRRNGRPQACDPCRSRKVACDNAQPVCMRCRKRSQQSDCVYTISSHSAPSSASPSAGARLRSRYGRRVWSPGRDSSSSESLPNVTASTAASPTSRTTGHNGGASSAAASSHPAAPKPAARTTPAAVSPTTNPVPVSRPGYLGFTSHSAVYEETRNSLSLLQGSNSISSGITSGAWSLPLTPADVAHVRAAGTLSSPTREMCFAVLKSLPDFETGDIPRTICPHLRDGWATIATGRIMKSLRAYLGPPADRTDSRLEQVAQMLCDNTSRSMMDNTTTAEEWLTQFTGENLRWESVGLVFSYRDPPLKKTPFGDVGFNDGQLSEGSPNQVGLLCLGLCIDLVKKFTDGNMLLLYISFMRAARGSTVLGDASIYCLRAHAETVSLLTFLGLHAEPETPHHVPTFGSELKRLFFAYIFNIDKVLAAFQGRPPLLGHRYTSMPIPLDIPGTELVGDREEFQRSLRCLDENGWNTNNKLAGATLVRGRVQVSYLLDELLEIALTNKLEASIDTLLDIKSREELIVAGFPPPLRYNPKDIDDQTMCVDTIYSRMLLQIEHLQNLFFVERLLLRRGHPDNGELLLISFEMVTLTLSFWMHKDRFSTLTAHFEWLVMNYAAPGGGILCMELLRPTFIGSHPRNPNLTRSAMIQQLSLLVGFLGWVSPDKPSAELCASCRTVIQHVLDHTLNASAAPWDGGGLPSESLEQFDATQLYFNFDLLDTFDWLRADEMGSETI